ATTGDQDPPTHHNHRSTIVIRMDLLLRNADVYDGTGAPAQSVDVAVTGGRISAIETRIDGAAAEIIDLTGLALAPGFIDIHTHSDVSLLHDPSGESK